MEAKQVGLTAYVVGGFVRDLCHSLLHPDATFGFVQPNGLDLDIVLVHDELTRKAHPTTSGHSIKKAPT